MAGVACWHVRWDGSCPLRLSCALARKENAPLRPARLLMQKVCCAPACALSPLPEHPPCLRSQALDDPMDAYLELEAKGGVKGCAYCGGLGHRIANCPKLRSETKAKERSHRDYLGSGGYGGEM